MTATANAPKGILAASVTPLTRQLQPHIPTFLDHSRWLLADGCDGLGILGTTGEANSLSIRQRLTLIEAATDALSGCYGR